MEQRSAADYTPTTKITTVNVRTPESGPCPEGCAHCGAYKLIHHMIGGALRMVDPEQFRENIRKEIQGAVSRVLFDPETGRRELLPVIDANSNRYAVMPEARKGQFEAEDRSVEEATGKIVEYVQARIVDLFSFFVTTSPDIEPLLTKHFAEYARIISEESIGRAKLIAVSHGLRAEVKEDGDGNRVVKVNPARAENLDEIVELMLTEDERGVPVVPAFVLTVDTQRAASYGKNKFGDAGEMALISAEDNRASYKATLLAMKPVLEEIRRKSDMPGMPKPRFTVSLQGVNGEDHLHIQEMWQGIIQEVRAEDPDFNSLYHYITDGGDRNMVGAGMFVENYPGEASILGDSAHAEMIPDESMVKRMHERKDTTLNQAILDVDGVLYTRPWTANRTYDDVIEFLETYNGKWKPLNNGDSGVREATRRKRVAFAELNRRFSRGGDSASDALIQIRAKRKKPVVASKKGPARVGKRAVRVVTTAPLSGEGLQAANDKGGDVADGGGNNEVKLAGPSRTGKGFRRATTPRSLGAEHIVGPALDRLRLDVGQVAGGRRKLSRTVQGSGTSVAMSDPRTAPFFKEE